MERGTKGPRIVGEVPPEYCGAVYYRLREDVTAAYGFNSFGWVNRSDPRLKKIFNAENRNKRILTSGLILDEGGALLPEWSVPLQARVKGVRLPLEFCCGEAGVIISERVREAIEALDCAQHIYVPVDAASDAGTKRFYVMFTPDAVFDDDPPLLHPKANRLRRQVFIGGSHGWKHPEWIMGSGDKHHFGYLDGRVLGKRQLFEDAGTLGNAYVFGPQLFARFASFGNIFQRWEELVPIGVSNEPDDDYDPFVNDLKNASSPKRQIFRPRLFGKP